MKAWVEAATDIRKKGVEVDVKLAGMGHISMAAFAGLLEGLAAEGEAVGRANAAALNSLSTRLNSMEVAQVMDSVVMVKVASAYKEGDTKLHLNLRNLDEDCIINSLTQLGAKLLRGVAPMGHLERIAHTHLADWSEV